MKNCKYFAVLMVASSAMLVAPVIAQADQSTDIWAGDRIVMLSAPQNIGVNGGQGVITNLPIDIIQLQGTAEILAGCYTNTGTTGGTLTLTVRGSADTTNWTTLANVAITTNTTAITYTNLSVNYLGTLYYGTNVVATNNYFLPFSPTTPTAPTAGFTTIYPLYIPLTNTAVMTLTPPIPGTVTGFRVTDAPRYLQAVWTAGGTVTNFTAWSYIVSPFRIQ